MTKKRPLNAKSVSSPDPLFPGHIVVGVTPTAAEYLAYWQALPKQRDEDTPANFSSFEARKNLVREWHIEGLTEQDREKAQNMPSLLLITWVNTVTGELIDEALDPKKVARATGRWLSGEGDCPWSIELALDCLDFRTGDIKFWPFPQKSWLENKYFLQAMREARRAYFFFSKEPSQWDSADNQYFYWLNS